MNRNIIKRTDAFLTGQKFFFTGRPCLRGHVVPRYTSSGGCTACMADNAKDKLSAFKAIRAGRFDRSDKRIFSVKVPAALVDAFKATCAALGVEVIEPKRDTPVQAGSTFVFPAHLTPPHPDSPEPTLR